MVLAFPPRLLGLYFSWSCRSRWLRNVGEFLSFGLLLCGRALKHVIEALVVSFIQFPP